MFCQKVLIKNCYNNSKMLFQYAIKTTIGGKAFTIHEQK